MWFDGYEGQDDVLMDDYQCSMLDREFFLRLLDRYPMQVPVKGGFVEWRPKRIIITSNHNPIDWYASEQNICDAAVQRRFDGIFEFK